MKKLLFNGCSFTAGDAFMWDTYCKEVIGEHYDWGDYSGTKKNIDYGHYVSNIFGSIYTTWSNTFIGIH